MPDTHTCPCGCGGQVPRNQFACKPGWSRLPKPYRDAITDAYRHRSRPGGLTAHSAAMRAAILWYRDHTTADRCRCQTDTLRYDGTHKEAAQCKDCRAPCICTCHQEAGS